MLEEQQSWLGSDKALGSDRALSSDWVLRGCTGSVCVQKTRAHHRLQDDVPVDVKKRRLAQLIATFREEAARANAALVGQAQLVLVEGVSVPGMELFSSLLTGSEAVHSSHHFCLPFLLSPCNPRTPKTISSHVSRQPDFSRALS